VLGIVQFVFSCRITPLRRIDTTFDRDRFGSRDRWRRRLPKVVFTKGSALKLIGFNSNCLRIIRQPPVRGVAKSTFAGAPSIIT